MDKFPTWASSIRPLPITILPLLSDLFPYLLVKFVESLSCCVLLFGVIGIELNSDMAWSTANAASSVL